MRFIYCPYCGSKLVKYESSRNGGGIPFCNSCKTILWEMFSTTVLIVVENELGEVVIIKQKNIRAIRYMCLYGMMKIGDSAEMAAIREVKEEFGLDVDKLEYIQSFPDKKREMLIVGFKASVKKSDLKLSSDIDDAEWVDIDEALNLLTNGSYGYKLTKLVKKRRKSQIKI